MEGAASAPLAGLRLKRLRDAHNLAGMADFCPSEMLAQLRAQVEAAPPDRPRIERIDLGGRSFWIKRVERPSWRMRLQKGNPRKGFEAERLALHDLGAAGAPVPPIWLEGRDYLVVPDCGRAVAAVLRHDPDPAARAAALRAAGRALGRLHALGFSHGRPSPKDMCLTGGAVTLIDFERYRRRLNTPDGHARDLVVFAFNTLVNALDDGPEVHDALAGHAETAPPGIWPLAQTWCRRMAWAKWLSRAAELRPEDRAREIRAIPRTLELFRHE